MFFSAQTMSMPTFVLPPALTMQRRCLGHGMARFMLSQILKHEQPNSQDMLTSLDIQGPNSKACVLFNIWSAEGRTRLEPTQWQDLIVSILSCAHVKMRCMAS